MLAQEGHVVSAEEDMTQEGICSGGCGLVGLGLVGSGGCEEGLGHGLVGSGGHGLVGSGGCGLVGLGGCGLVGSGGCGLVGSGGYDLVGSGRCGLVEMVLFVQEDMILLVTIGSEGCGLVCVVLRMWSCWLRRSLS